MKLHLPNFQSLHLLVVGDVMLDRYWYGETSRISPEAPVPIVQVHTSEARPGGAGNVAVNIAALGSKVSLFGICGDDEAGQALRVTLANAQVNDYLTYHNTLQTTIKQRVLSQHQQLLRLDFENTPINPDFAPSLSHYKTLLPKAQAMIFSDYGKGMVKKAAEFIALAKQQDIPVIVDPKGTDFTYYQGATVLTPNRKEFEAVVGVCDSEEAIATKAFALIHSLNLKALLLTRGEQGMSLFQLGLPALHLPARTHDVYDVTGAGDTVAAVLAMMLGGGESLPQAATLANVAAGLVVGKLGAATVELSELQNTLVQSYPMEQGILTQEGVVMARRKAKLRGERVVLTNGCFDLLHAGHVAYLNEAKALGDRLIVAVNDDDSVARLKGQDRPINSLKNRMAVLAGLSAVDWVVSFSEDTPADLINLLLPDVLVKGGDYQSQTIVGSNSVLAQGGEVKVLPFVEGCSTTNLLKKIRHTEKMEVL